MFLKIINFSYIGATKTQGINIAKKVFLLFKKSLKKKTQALNSLIGNTPLLAIHFKYKSETE